MRCGAGSTPATSGREGLAALATAGSQDGAAGAGPHAQAEAVRLGATTVVRLERTLAHEISYGFGDPPGKWGSATIGHQHARPARSPGARARACDSGRHEGDRITV